MLMPLAGYAQPAVIHPDGVTIVTLFPLRQPATCVINEFSSTDVQYIPLKTGQAVEHLVVEMVVKLGSHMQTNSIDIISFLILICDCAMR